MPILTSLPFTEVPQIPSAMLHGSNCGTVSNPCAKSQNLSPRAEQLMSLGGVINVPADKLASLNKSDGIERLQTPPEKGGGTAAILEF